MKTCSIGFLDSRAPPEAPPHSAGVVPDFLAELGEVDRQTFVLAEAFTVLTSSPHKTRRVPGSSLFSAIVLFPDTLLISIDPLDGTRSSGGAAALLARVLLPAKFRARKVFAYNRMNPTDPAERDRTDLLQSFHLVLCCDNVSLARDAHSLAVVKFDLSEIVFRESEYVALVTSLPAQSPSLTTIIGSIPTSQDSSLTMLINVPRGVLWVQEDSAQRSSRITIVDLESGGDEITERASDEEEEEDN